MPETLGKAALLVDWISPDGLVMNVSKEEANALHVDAAAMVGQPLEALYGGDSAQQIRSMIRRGLSTEKYFPVWMNCARHGAVPAVATAVFEPSGATAIIKMPLGAAELGIGHELAERVEILSQMIGAATEACWCIELLEPVDTSQSEDEIVSQIFKNRSRWRACNDAMARLYAVPEGLDFNTQPVSLYFPETEVNRAMIRDLVRSNYRLDHAVAVDSRHDGSEMLVENDFRAAIHDGFLVRLWGTTRDIGPHRRREQQLSDQASSVIDVLSAAPDPILVLSEDGAVLAANPAACQAFGYDADQILGRPFQSFVETRNVAARLQALALSGDDGETGIDISIVDATGARENWRFHVAATEGEYRRFVLTARRKSRRKSSATSQEERP